MRRDPIIIAGGGIGGLAAAVALARKGFQITVLERAARYQEIGAGIQLGPNAFHAFDHLGLGDAARATAVFIDQLRLMDAISAEEITSVDLTDYFRRRFGNPYAVVHRGDLHSIFLRACEAVPAITLRSDCDVVGYDQDGTAVVARLKSGERVTGRLLIGADGLRSRIRQQMVDDGPPRIAGHTTYRSVIRPSKCRRICAGTLPPCGPARGAIWCIIRCPAGRSSTSPSLATTIPWRLSRLGQ